jgi:transcriptional regulator with XRE-family HTH domain
MDWVFETPGLEPCLIGHAIHDGLSHKATPIHIDDLALTLNVSIVKSIQLGRSLAPNSRKARGRVPQWAWLPKRGRSMSSVSGMEDDHPDSPHAVDRLVGNRIRLRRRELGVSQENLARELGVSFQQVQKYERAANRVSASKLFEIASVLRVPPNYFFEGISARQEPSGSPDAAAEPAFLATAEGAELAQFFPKLHEAERRQILELVRALADEGREPSQD